MAPETSVERQFRFQCSCGATMESGETTVTCTGCGAYLGIRRVRRHRQQLRDSVAYYGSRTRPVRRVERPRKQPVTIVAAEAQTIPHKVRVDPLTSVESDFEDHRGDAPHGGFIIFLLLPLIALIVVFYRSCTS